MSKTTDIHTESGAKIELLVSCIADVFDKFTPTGETTPAHGVCYENVELDMFATVYDHGCRARVFFNREKEFMDRKRSPCFFEDEITLTS